VEWVKRNAPLVLLAIALPASVGVLLWLTRDMTFLQDTWDLLMNRRDPTVDALLNPHNEHIVLIPTLLEQLLLRAFGMSDATPEYVLQSTVLAASGGLFFVYVRRRVGDWLALFATLLLLFLGPAWEVLLWPFEISFAGSVLFGLAMLLALERGDRRGDIAACVFLLLSFGFSSVAIPFAAAAAVDIFQKRRIHGLARAYVVLVPVALFGLWYLGWGSEAESHLSLRNVMTSPRFVLDSAAVAAAALVGLGESALAGPVDPSWGRPLLIAAAVALGYRFLRGRKIPPGLWPIAAAAATNWFLTAFNASAGRAPVSSRYQYMGAVLILLLLANLLQGERLSRRAVAIGAVLTAMVLSVNLILLRDGRDTLMIQSVYTQSDLAGIEIAKRTVAPDFWLDSVVAGTPTLVNVQADKYLAAVEEYGSPAYTPDELAAAPDYGRKQADIVLSQALPLGTLTRLGAFDPRGGGKSCVTLPAGSLTPESELRISAGLTRIELAPGPRAEFSLRRFATGEFPVPTEGAPGNSVTELRVPRDAAPRYPWYLHVDASQAARVCR
jgi:hypothetical protein